MNFTQNTILFIYRFLDIYILLIIIRAVLSLFINNISDFKLFNYIIFVTDPILLRIRKILNFPNIDVSPLIAIFIIRFIQKLLLGFN